MRRYTETGRVVYERKTHFFTPSDFNRIAGALEIERKKTRGFLLDFFLEVIVQQYQDWIDGIIDRALDDIQSNLGGQVDVFSVTSENDKRVVIIEEI